MYFYGHYISKYFLETFISNLEEVFSYTIKKDFMIYNTGTVGWSRAFESTCESFNANELLKYYNHLDWEEFDRFCSELGMLIIDKELVK